MAKFGSTSLKRLSTCRPEIQQVMNAVIDQLPYTCPDTGYVIADCGIIEGHRGEVQQNYLYDTDKTQVRFPDSYHNKFPSDAVDTLPMEGGKYIWTNKDKQESYAKLVLATAWHLGFNWTWGADWDGDGVRVDKDNDEKFFDGPHFQMEES